MAVLKKHWVQVMAPSMFKHEHLGDSYVGETSTLQGRGITVNLMNITGDMKKQNLNVSFRITNIKEGKAYTRAVGLEMQPSSVKRLVRRGRTKIDASFLVQLKHGQVCRIKPLVITKALTNNSTAASLRHKLQEVVQDALKDVAFETLVYDVVNQKLQRYVRTQLNSIYPIRSVDIRVAQLLPKHSVEEEHELETSTYGGTEGNAEEDGERG